MKTREFILALSIALLVPLALSAGSQRDADSAVSAVEVIYGERDDIEVLKSAVSKAVDAGIPAEEVESFIREAAAADRDSGEVAGYVNNASELFSLGIPQTLLFNTLLEGFVKGVEKDDLLRSIGPLRSRLLLAGKITENHTGRRGKGSEQELLLSAIFYSMNMGYAEKEIEALSKAAGETSLTGREFFEILKISMELSSLDLEPVRVTAIMERSIRNGITIRQMSGYPSFVREGREKGLAQDDIYSFLMAKADEILTSEKSQAGAAMESGKKASPPAKGGSAGGGPSAGGSSGGGK